MCQGTSWIYSRLTPTFFCKWLPSSGGHRYLRSYSNTICVVGVYLVQLQSNFVLPTTVIISTWCKQGHGGFVAVNAVAKYSALHPVCSKVQNKEVRLPVCCSVPPRHRLMYITGGTRWGSGWGTALQTGRSRDRFPMVSLEFFIYIILPAIHGPGVDPGSNRNEYQEYFLGVKAAGE
jgi:hypothetical protein